MIGNSPYQSEVFFSIFFSPECGQFFCVYGNKEVVVWQTRRDKFCFFDSFRRKPGRRIELSYVNPGRDNRGPVLRGNFDRKVFEIIP